jgi:hypothetical protein
MECETSQPGIVIPPVADFRMGLEGKVLEPMDEARSNEEWHRRLLWKGCGAVLNSAGFES